MTREQILNLKVGDMVRFPNSPLNFQRAGAPIVSIYAQRMGTTLAGEDHAFAGFYVQAESGLTVSAGILELTKETAGDYAEIISAE